MELNKNSFPVNINREQALETILSNFKEKGHSIKISKKDIYMTIVPYWFCFYDIYSKKNNKFETISGQIALNSQTNKIEDNLTILFKYGNPKLIKKLLLPAIEKIDIRVKEKLINKEESKKTISQLLCSKYEVNLEDITLTGFVEIWVPYWKIKVDSQKYKLDAVGGKINNLNTIEIKEKTNSELFLDFLEDMKNPNKSWIYFKNFFLNVFNLIIELFKFIIKYKTLFLIVLIIILIYLLLY
jgi:hypothetical protein